MRCTDYRSGVEELQKPLFSIPRDLPKGYVTSYRINRALALLESDQPIYYVGGHSGHVLYKQIYPPVGAFEDHTGFHLERPEGEDEGEELRAAIACYALIW